MNFPQVTQSRVIKNKIIKILISGKEPAPESRNLAISICPMFGFKVGTSDFSKIFEGAKDKNQSAIHADGMENMIKPSDIFKFTKTHTDFFTE